MPKNTTDMQSMFSSIANRYDTLNTILTLNIDSIWRNKAIKICELKEDDKLLDLCCGTGAMIENASKIIDKDTEIIGLDFTEQMLEIGKNRLNKSLKGYKFKLIKGDAINLPFEDNSFDCVTIAFGLRNISDKMKALSEIYRVLKPGGKAVCLELSKPEVPVFKNIYNAYFNHVLPLIGYIGTKDKKAYYYLRDSVNNFMSKTELKTAFYLSKFKETGFISLTFGVASIHYGKKALSNDDIFI